MTIQVHPHALARMRERGATLTEVRRTIRLGTAGLAKFGRSRFRRIELFNTSWNGKLYARKQIDVVVAKIQDGWLVVTVIVKYF